MALQRVEMRMVRATCGIRVKNAGKVSDKELRERPGIEDIILVLQQTGYDGMGMCCKRRTVIG